MDVSLASLLYFIKTCFKIRNNMNLIVSSFFLSEKIGIPSLDPQSIVGILPQPNSFGTRYKITILDLFFIVIFDGCYCTTSQLTPELNHFNNYSVFPVFQSTNRIPKRSLSPLGYN